VAWVRADWVLSRALVQALLTVFRWRKPERARQINTLTE
jgi:hypothetical protein